MNIETTRVAAIVLAAGEGTRIKARGRNKVSYKLAGKPMISYTVETIRRAGIRLIIVVVKFQEASVRNVLGSSVVYARQGEKKGTAAALQDGITALPRSITDVVVMHGDDSAFYTPELLHFLLKEHVQTKSDVTLLSIRLKDPTGIGRIIRDHQGKILGIVEEKVATEDQKKITEVNAGCYCFRVPFLRTRLSEISMNPVSKEYYLTDIVEVALSHKDRIRVCFYPDDSIWFGVNTRSQWGKARALKQRQQ